jgi:hypothetical protein
VAEPLDPAIRGDLDDLLAALDGLRQADFARLHAFWNGVEPERRAAAHAHAQEAADRTGRRDEIRRVQDELYEWGAAGRRRGTTGWGEQWVDPGQPEVGDSESRQSAVPALLDTATALALQDTLDEVDFDALFGPWANAMGGADDRSPDDAAPDEAAPDIAAPADSEQPAGADDVDPDGLA